MRNVEFFQMIPITDNYLADTKMIFILFVI